MDPLIAVLVAVVGVIGIGIGNLITSRATHAAAEENRKLQVSLAQENRETQRRLAQDAVRREWRQNQLASILTSANHRFGTYMNLDMAQTFRLSTEPGTSAHAEAEAQVKRLLEALLNNSDQANQAWSGSNNDELLAAIQAYQAADSAMFAYVLGRLHFRQELAGQEYNQGRSDLSAAVKALNQAAERYVFSDD